MAALRIGNAEGSIDFRPTNSFCGPNHQKWRSSRKFDMDDVQLKILVLEALEKFMADLTALNAAVAANTQAVTDMQALITSLKAQIATLEASNTDQAGVDADTQQITANTTALEALKTA